MSKRIDLTGQRFGRLVVIDVIKEKGKRKKLRCRCQCGKMVEVSEDKLKSGHTKSCGCLWIETIKERNSTHGKTKTKLYGIWQSMINRTTNENVWNFKNYGGRGITICEEWKRNFISFYEWAMKNGYKEGLSIDRKNNNKGYSPDNCRWATAKEQGSNTRRNVYITYKNETLTEAQWADRMGLSRSTLCYRLKAGWSVEDALETPVKGNKT